MADKVQDDKLFNDLADTAQEQKKADTVTNRKGELTDQQDLFCFWAVYLCNFAEAYRRAYHVGKDTKPSTVYQAVNDLKKNPKIRLRINYYRRTVLSKNILTADEILQNLSEIALKWRADDKNLPHSLRALENLGEYRGVLKSKTDANNLNFADAVINFNTNFDTYKKDIPHKQQAQGETYRTQRKKDTSPKQKGVDYNAGSQTSIQIEKNTIENNAQGGDNDRA